MPRTDDDVLRELLHRATDDLHAPSAVTAGIVTRHHRRLRNTRILSITTTSVAAAAVVLWNPLLSPALRAAMYKVLAATPGVEVKTGTTDKIGRPSRSAGKTASPARDSQLSKAPAPAPCSSRTSAMSAPPCTRRSPATPPLPPTPTAAAEAIANGPAPVIRPAAERGAGTVPSRSA
jgi:hypothetical protein